MWLQRIITHTGIAPSPTATLKESTHVSCKFPGIRPLDIGINTTTGLKGLDVTITGTAPATSNSAHQEQACKCVHTQEEVLKWRGSSRPNNITAERESNEATIKGH
eukprot:1911841-Ditylum_brightwellii.AAC.1